MTLSNILAITGDHHARLDAGVVTVNLQADEADYWHLSDYSVSSRDGMMLIMVPVATHATNGWQHHFIHP